MTVSVMTTMSQGAHLYIIRGTLQGCLEWEAGGGGGGQSEGVLSGGGGESLYTLDVRDGVRWRRGGPVYQFQDIVDITI